MREHVWEPSYLTVIKAQTGYLNLPKAPPAPEDANAELLAQTLEAEYEAGELD